MRQVWREWVLKWGKRSVITMNLHLKTMTTALSMASIIIAAPWRGIGQKDIILYIHICMCECNVHRFIQWEVKANKCLRFFVRGWRIDRIDQGVNLAVTGWTMLIILSIYRNKEEAEMEMLRRSFGLAFPLKLQMERKAAKKVKFMCIR